MAVLLREIIKGYKYYIYEVSDQRTIDWPLMGSPLPVIAIVGVYLWFVLKAGPAFMKNRAPFELDKIIQVYNLVQVITSTHLIYVAITQVYGPWGHYSIICQPLDWSDTPFNKLLLSKFYIYFTLKIVDLLDTVFFVLRKKQNQVTFLHVYHHSLMVLTIWYAMRFIPGGHTVYVGFVNSFVHAIMYAYYFITNYNKEYRKNIWWKKYITQLQLVQFASIFLHCLLLLAQPDCEFPRIPVYFLIPQNFFITILFWDFYRKAYLKPKPQSNTTKSE